MAGLESKPQLQPYRRSAVWAGWLKVAGDAGQLRQAIRDSAVQGKPQPLLMRIERAGRVQELTLQPLMKDVQGKAVPRIEAGLAL